MSDQPPVRLLLAPEGQCQAAFQAAMGAGDVAYVNQAYPERLFVARQGELTMDIVRYLVTSAATRKHTHVVLWLDGVAPAVYPALLKLLEETPHVRFLLAATSAPDTIRSRSAVIHIGLAEDISELTEYKAAVREALTAAVSRDQRRLARSLRKWNAGDIAMLAVWASETVSGRWHVFGPGDGQGLGREAALNVLSALHAYRGARPRIKAQAALESVHGR